MKDRGEEILRLLLQNRQFKINNLEQELGLTKRQINYAINQLNEFLQENKIPIIERTSKGKFIVSEEVYKILADKKKSDDYYLADERMDLLFCYLFAYPSEVSLYHLIDFLKVSKNTVLSDIRELNSLLESRHLKIKFTRKKGYYLSGAEYSLRTYLNEVIRRNIKFNRTIDLPELDIQSYTNEAMHIISSIEKEIGIRYSDDSFLFLMESLKFTLLRNTKSNTLHIKEFIIPQSAEYKVIDKLYAEHLSKNEKLWMTLLFLTSNLYMNTDEFLIDKNKNLLGEVDDLMESMITQFENYRLIEIVDREIFKTRLIMHMRPAIFRMIYEINIEDYSSKILNNEDLILSPIMKRIIKPIEDYIGKKVPDDELKLMTLYFETQIYEIKSANLKKRAAVVCSNGIVVSKVIFQMLTKLFPEIAIINTMSVREFMLVSRDYDLVFTTTPLNVEVSQYLVKPTLNAREQAELRQTVLLDLKIGSVEKTADKIIRLVKEKRSIDNIESFKDEIVEILMEKNTHSERFNCLPELSDYLDVENIQIVDQVKSWEEAVRIAFKPLLNQGVVSQQYLEECINQMKQEQNFAYFGSNMAIPHSSLVEEIRVDKISFLLCKEPIAFPKFKAIHYIVPLAIKGGNTHLRAINQLADFSQHKLSLTRSLACRNEIELYQLLTEEI